MSHGQGGIVEQHKRGKIEDDIVAPMHRVSNRDGHNSDLRGDELPDIEATGTDLVQLRVLAAEQSGLVRRHNKLTLVSPS